VGGDRRGGRRAAEALDAGELCGQLAQRAAVVRVQRLAVRACLAQPVVVAAADAVERRIGDEPPRRVDAVLQRRDGAIPSRMTSFVGM
jgi:hypothetical protein